MTPKLPPPSPPPQPLRLPSSVLLLLLSILIIPTSSHAYNFSASCNTTSTCGNLIKISYPFCFYEEIDVLSSSYCGYEGFKVTCGNNIPFLHSNDAKKYKIIHIDYDAHIISIVDADIFSDQCLRLRHNFTLSPLSTLRYASSDANLTFFFDCADGPAEYRIPCFGHRPRNQSYVLTSEAMANSSRSPRNCDEVVVAPVLEDLLQSCNPNDLPNIYGRVLRGGFNLSWPHESSGQCNRCESSGGRCGLSQTSNSTWPFTCFCLDGIKTFPYCGAGVAAKKKINILSVLIVIVMALASAVPFMLFLSVFVYIMCSRKPHKNNWQNAELFLQQHESLIQKRYKYSEVQRMTKSFSNKLGQGGFGSVYKGTLQDGRIVAVKLLSESEGDGGEFINEVASISKTSHVNVVTLLGFCLEKSKRALIYEFMPNGSLEKFVYSDRSNTETQLDCEKLYEIATGIARGLEYLHNGCNTRIVHFDIKPHNILLDHNCCPKISDFGLAKLCPSRESIISMATARGTIGYIAPEVFSRSFGVVSSKSDVYSYGMMLLEIVGGRKKMDAENERSSEVYFPQWIYDDIDRYCKVGIPGITSETEEFMRKMTVVGLWCIQIMPENRPPMSKVVEMLNGSVDDLQIPPRP